jgi:hypothetical protein
MTALVRTSSNCKRQTHTLIREDVRKDYNRKGSVEKRMLAVSLKGFVAKTN